MCVCVCVCVCVCRSMLLVSQNAGESWVAVCPQTWKHEEKVRKEEEGCEEGYEEDDDAGAAPLESSDWPRFGQFFTNMS